MFYRPIDEAIKEIKPLSILPEGFLSPSWKKPLGPNDRKFYTQKKLVSENNKKRQAKKARKKNRKKKK